MIEARAQRNAPALVAALRARGWAEREVFAFDAAKRTLDEAARVARRCELFDQLAEVLATRASVLLEQGRVSAARRDIASAREAVGGRTTPEIDAQEAIIEDAVGDLATAIRLYRAAIRRGGSHLPVETGFTLHNNLGRIFSQTGDLSGARKHLDQAAKLAAQLGRNKLGYVTHNQATVALRAGSITDALRWFDEAERILRDVGMPLAEHYMERFDAFMALRLLDEAIDASERAITEFEQGSFTLLVGEARLRQARAFLAAGHRDDALISAARAAKELTTARRVAWCAQAELVQLTAKLANGGAVAEDLRAARRCAAQLRRSGFVDEAGEAHLVAADIALALGRRAAAIRELEQLLALPATSGILHRVRRYRAAARRAELVDEPQVAVRAAGAGLRLLARYRRSLPTSELRALAAGHGVELAVIGARRALVRGHGAGLLGWIERGRAVATLHEPPRYDDDRLAELFGELRDVLAQRHESDESDPSSTDQHVRRQARLEAAIQARLRTLDPIAIEADAVTPVSAIVDAVGERALITIGDIAGSLTAVSVYRGAVRLHLLGRTADAVAEQAAVLFSLRRLIAARSERQRVASQEGLEVAIARLDAMLIAPLVEEMDGATSCVISPPAPLFATPWHTLPSLRSHAISITPSATAWMRALAPRQSQRHVALIAGPRLEAADNEVDQLCRLYGAPRPLHGSDATVAATLAVLDGAAIAHFACHGSFRADNPSFSSLELADGPLTVLELEQLGHAPAVVVLAACDSGVSEALPGDELLGLVGALIAKGTRAVVASVVGVPDLMATPMMVSLHTAMCGGASVAESLRVARNSLDIASRDGLVTATAFGCFGAGDVTTGRVS